MDAPRRPRPGLGHASQGGPPELHSIIDFSFGSFNLSSSGRIGERSEDERREEKMRGEAMREEKGRGQEIRGEERRKEERPGGEER